MKMSCSKRNTDFLKQHFVTLTKTHGFEKRKLNNARSYVA